MRDALKVCDPHLSLEGETPEKNEAPQLWQLIKFSGGGWHIRLVQRHCLLLLEVIKRNKSVLFPDFNQPFDSRPGVWNRGGNWWKQAPAQGYFWRAGGLWRGRSRGGCCSSGRDQRFTGQPKDQAQYFCCGQVQHRSWAEKLPESNYCVTGLGLS